MIVQLTDYVLLPFHILDQNLFQIVNAHACVVIRDFFVYVVVFNNGCMSGFGISFMSSTVSSFAIGFKCADMIGWGARMLNTLRKTDKSFLLQSVASTDECGFSHTRRCTDDGRGAGNRHLPIVAVRLVEQIEVERCLCMVNCVLRLVSQKRLINLIYSMATFPNLILACVLLYCASVRQYFLLFAKKRLAWHSPSTPSTPNA